MPPDPAPPAPAAACPICGKPGAETHRPFCSRRCADIDLGRWLTGQYVLPGPALEAVEDEADGRAGERNG
jgi:endogenous inhibitor of DNA gyrase (YacG/DUF329 family)